MRKKKSSGIIARVLITFIGLAFIAWAMTTIVLGIFGAKGTAVINTVRRELGERNETIPNRYTYQVGYTFVLPNGSQVSGFSQKIAGAVYLKADGTKTLAVRYFPFFPYINTPEDETRPGYKQLILTGVGFFLILVMRRRKIKPRKPDSNRMR